MMRIMFLLLLAFTANAFSQTATDTVFLLREKNHRIYIEPNPLSEACKGVLSFSVARESTAYKESLAYLNKKYPRPAQRFSTLGISGKWYPLFLYKGNYYLYAPCDNIYLHSFSIAFDGVTDQTPEGFVVNRINSYTRNGNSHVLQLDGYFSGEVKRTIHIIDAERGIAVIEEKRGSNPAEYRLAVHSITAAGFPVIVNECLVDKQFEYAFDVPDYKALLKNRK